MDEFKILEKYLCYKYQEQKPEIKPEQFMNTEKTIIAIDNSGSTSGKILRSTKLVINKIVEGIDNNSKFLNNICK